LEAIKTVIGKMGKPESMYTDNEGAWSAGTEIDKYFKETGINHIITLSHAAVADEKHNNYDSYLDDEEELSK